MSDPAPRAVRTIRRGNITTQFLISPFKDLQIVRACGPLDDIEELIEKFFQVYTPPEFEVKAGKIIGVENGRASILLFRWIDNETPGLSEMKSGQVFATIKAPKYEDDKVAHCKYIGVAKHTFGNVCHPKSGIWVWAQGNIVSDFPDEVFEQIQYWYQKHKDGTYKLIVKAPTVTQEDIEIIRARSSVG